SSQQVFKPRNCRAAQPILENAVRAPNVLRQSGNIAVRDLFKIDSQAPAKQLPGSRCIDARKYHQQTSHLSACPQLVFGDYWAGTFFIDIRRAQPTVAELAVSRPGKNTEWA